MINQDTISDVMLVIQTIALGYVPTVACDRVGLSYSTFVRYTKPEYEELHRLRTEAEDRLYDLMAEALPQIFTHPIYGVPDAKEAQVVSNNIKWLLERRRQKAYGTHSVIEHTITADREILDALNKAKARAHGLVIDAVASRIPQALTAIDDKPEAGEDFATPFAPSGEFARDHAQASDGLSAISGAQPRQTMPDPPPLSYDEEFRSLC